MQITIEKNNDKKTENKFEQIEQRLGLSQSLLLDYIADYILKNIDNVTITQNGIEIKTRT